ncbi:no significant blast hit [Histoplasma capsulatum var. duboisii H88]|uniref:No significant blast hit n=1 Tax=Ajellomyces capsulatus (strain H88) TaxID=544711 RepID=A0A8A1LFW1_AJEC8|nr:no significant blast hit [Histoplasma capsulatum var. duboisii H88]
MLKDSCCCPGKVSPNHTAPPWQVKELPRNRELHDKYPMLPPQEPAHATALEHLGAPPHQLSGVHSYSTFFIEVFLLERRRDQRKLRHRIPRR